MAKAKTRTLIMKSTKRIKTCESSAYLPVKKMKEHPDNPRDITHDSLDELKASIVAKGLYRPFLVWSEGNLVLSGSQRLRAVVELMSEGYEIPEKGLPVVFYSNPDPAMAKKVLVESNTHKGRWVDELLEKLIKEGEEAGIRASEYGLSQNEIDKIMTDSDQVVKETLGSLDRNEFDSPGVTEPKEREKDQPLLLAADVYEQYMDVLGEIASGLNDDWKRGDSIQEAAQALIQKVREFGLVDKICDPEEEIEEAEFED